MGIVVTAEAVSGEAGFFVGKFFDISQIDPLNRKLDLKFVPVQYIAPGVDTGVLPIPHFINPEYNPGSLEPLDGLKTLNNVKYSLLTMLLGRHFLSSDGLVASLSSAMGIGSYQEQGLDITRHNMKRILDLAVELRSFDGDIQDRFISLSPVIGHDMTRYLIQGDESYVHALLEGDPGKIKKVAGRCIGLAEGSVEYSLAVMQALSETIIGYDGETDIVKVLGNIGCLFLANGSDPGMNLKVYQALHGEIFSQNLTITDLAKKIGINRATFTSRLNHIPQEYIGREPYQPLTRGPEYNDINEFYLRYIENFSHLLEGAVDLNMNFWDEVFPSPDGPRAEAIRVLYRLMKVQGK